ncbi:MAG TPA: PDZ domain-containing protein [Vicinamibacterales bacterium]|jgi:serine protease Do
MRCVALITALLIAAGSAGTAQAQTPPRSGDFVRPFPFMTTGSQVGISIRDLEANEASKLKLPGEAGAVVQSVQQGSPAETAGIREGDVVVEFDGERVRSAQQLTRLVRETPPGRQVNAAVIRDGRRTQLKVMPEASRNELPFNADRFRDSFDRFWPLGRGTLGVVTQEMTPELAAYFGAKDGVLVTSVQQDSAAEKAGIRVGDVITEFAGVSVGHPRDLVRAVVSRQGEVALKVIRDKKEVALKATLDERNSDRRFRQRPVRGI